MQLWGISARDMEIQLLNQNDRSGVTTALKAQIRYVTDLGVSFLLRCSDALDHDILAHVNLVFEDTASGFP
jgi:hypothetical protein